MFQPFCVEMKLVYWSSFHLAESSDQLLVHWLVTVISQDAEQGLPEVEEENQDSKWYFGLKQT